VSRRPTKPSSDSMPLIEAPPLVRGMGWTLVAMGAIGGTLFLLASLTDPGAPVGFLIAMAALWAAYAIRRGWRMAHLSVGIDGEALVIRNERRTSTVPIDLIEAIHVSRRRSPFGRIVQGVVVAGNSQWVIQATKVFDASQSEEAMYHQLRRLSRRLGVPIRDVNP
jgi:hypothetical protein